MLKKVLLNIFVLTTLALTSWAQEFKIEVNAPRITSENQGFRVEFKMNGKPDSFQAPSFEGFDVAAGPSTSQSTSVSIINGNMKSTMQYIISYVLNPTKEGTFTIGKATATSNKKQYQSEEHHIEVVSGGAGNSGGGNSGNSSGSSNRGGGTTRQQATNGEFNKEDIVLVMSLNKNNVYKGEPIIATLKLYYRVSIDGLDNAKYPSFDGFWNQELPQRQKLEITQEKYNDKIYEVATLREYLIFPQQDGEITIDPTTLSVVARIATQDNSPSGDLFDAFFGGGRMGYRDIRLAVSSKPVKVNVKSYPSPIPASFNGAVGDFKVSGTLSSDIISANNSSSITFKITGTGNIPLIQEPKIELPESFELYKVKSEDDIKTSVRGTTGSKTFTYPFIARAKGSYKIKGIDFTYFNPKTGRFVTQNTGDLSIEVKADSLGTTGGVDNKIITGVSKEELKILGKDISYIAVSAPDLMSKDEFFLFSTTYWIILIALVILTFATFYFIDSRIKASKDGVKVKSKRATRIAMNRLKEAKSYMDDSESGKFYDATMRAMWGYVSDKLNIPVAQLSRDNVSDKLSLKGIGEDLTGQFLSAISACEEARYSPQSDSRMNEVYELAVQSITQIEDKL